MSDMQTVPQAGMPPQGGPAPAPQGPGGPPLNDGMLEGEQEMFEGGGIERDALPIPVTRMAAEELLNVGETEINVQLEQGMVDLRLFIDEDVELDDETLDTGTEGEGTDGGTEGNSVDGPSAVQGP